jgi:hypothetical protein
VERKIRRRRMRTKNRRRKERSRSMRRGRSRMKGREKNTEEEEERRKRRMREEEKRRRRKSTRRKIRRRRNVSAELVYFLLMGGRYPNCRATDTLSLIQATETFDRSKQTSHSQRDQPGRPGMQLRLDRNISDDLAQNVWNVPLPIMNLTGDNESVGAHVCLPVRRTWEGQPGFPGLRTTSLPTE